MFSSNTTQVEGGYQISRSLRFNRSDSAYLTRTPSSTGSRTIFTLSLWIKLGNFTTGNDSFMWASGDASVGDAPALLWKTFDGSCSFVFNAGTSTDLKTTAVYRDPSAWYHVVVAVDTTQATASNRIKMYVNGVQITSFSASTYPSQNLTYNVNTSSYPAYLGCLYAGGTIRFWEGYQTEVNFIDGSQLTPSSFGETNAQTGVWQPKAYSGSYGTNGFYLNFSDNSNTTAATLGKDYSGNGNNWTPNNFSVTAGAGNDSLVDSPTSYGTDTGVGGTVRGNYATLNPLDKGTYITTVNGNLDVVASTQWQGIRATLGMSSGKWYCEYTPTSGTYHIVSISQPQAVMDGYIVNNSTAWGYGYDGSKYNGGSTTSYGATWGVGDTIGIAFDADAGTITFYKNNTSQGVAYSGLTSGPYLVGVGVYPSATGTFNFGQRPFAYTAPSGFKALCTQNLPTPTIGATTATQAGKYFNPVLYTGNSSTLAVTGVGFQPDFVWAKGRSVAYSHGLFDAVRGVTKKLTSNSTNAEATESGLTAFNSDGFTLGSDVGLNQSTSTYVAWNWKANGSGSTNTAGSITTTVSANTTSGFSIAIGTTPSSGGATYGHGLGVAPSFIFAKSTAATSDWFVYHASLGFNQDIRLNTTSAASSTTFTYNSADASTVTIGGSSVAAYWGGNAPWIWYNFAEVAGYSKFGSYTGNGSADGVFVYTGFRPAYLLIKRTTSAYDWWILDAARGTVNAVRGRLYANDSGAESTTYPYVDFLSNGFKLRDADGGNNASGEPYIYACFASAPFKYALAR
jgi:hypothetical protein